MRSAPSAAVPPERSIGTWPAPEKNFFWSQPLMPGPVKYSALARKVTRRGSDSGMKIQSEYDRWLLARIAAPVGRDVLGALDLGPEDEPQHGPERRPT